MHPTPKPTREDPGLSQPPPQPPQEAILQSENGRGRVCAEAHCERQGGQVPTRPTKEGGGRNTLLGTREGKRKKMHGNKKKKGREEGCTQISLLTYWGWTTFYLFYACALRTYCPALPILLITVSSWPDPTCVQSYWSPHAKLGYGGKQGRV